MNKTITIYELLGLIKDGEKVPKKVKYCGEIYTYIKINRQGIRYINEERDSDDDYRLLIFSANSLNDTVEIIEEDKKIEKINITEDSSGNKFIEDDNHKYTIRVVDKYFADKINELINKVNSMEEKLDER